MNEMEQLIVEKSVEKSKVKHGNKYDTETFIQKAKLIHGDNCDYSLVKYIDCKTHVEIICNRNKNHDNFWQVPVYHLQGNSCPVCGIEGLSKNQVSTKEIFIEKAILKHGDSCDYSKVIYINNKTKVEIIHKKCGKSFWQTPNNHLTGYSCSHCKESWGEKAVRAFLEENQIKYCPQEWFEDTRNPCRNPKTNRPLPFDFYLPKYNLVCEYMGKQHYKPSSWGTDKTDRTKNKNLEIIKFRDNLKQKWCSDNKVKFLEIHYKDFNNIETILKKELGLQE